MDSLDRFWRCHQVRSIAPIASPSFGKSPAIGLNVGSQPRGGRLAEDGFAYGDLKFDLGSRWRVRFRIDLRQRPSAKFLEGPAVLQIYEGIGAPAISDIGRLPANNGGARRLRSTVCHEPVGAMASASRLASGASCDPVFPKRCWQPIRHRGRGLPGHWWPCRTECAGNR
jgi:hypothetical protein